MSRKLLVVDDDPAARKLLTLLLQATCEVLLAPSGAEALRIIEAEKPGLMLLDMNMPGMSGVEVLKAARACGVVMPVIVVTGRNDVDLAKQVLDLGAVEFVTKPFNLPQLKEKVMRCLGIGTREKPKNDATPWRTVDHTRPHAGL